MPDVKAETRLFSLGGHIKGESTFKNVLGSPWRVSQWGALTICCPEKEESPMAMNSQASEDLKALEAQPGSSKTFCQS